MVIVSFSILFGFFTVFNVATNGYDLQLQYTDNPNSTFAESQWFNNVFFTWGDDKLKPVCQEQNLQIGTEFMTTNMGLSYTIRAITSPSNNSHEIAQHSSISYLNNVLQNCRVNVVNVYLRKADWSAPPSFWWSWMFNSGGADVLCDVVNGAGTFTIRFDVSYGGLARSYDYVAIDNYRTHASVWWGTRILNNYFNGIQVVMSTLSIGQDVIITNGQLGYLAPNVTVTSIKDDKMFGLTYYLLASDGSITNEADDGLSLETYFNNPRAVQSLLLTEGLSFAKVFSSLILVDMGDTQAPNLLLDPDLVQYALDAPDDFNRNPRGPLHDASGEDWWKSRGISPPGQPSIENNTVPMNQAWEQFKDQMGPLGTRNASIYTQYSCSVPVKKSLASVVLGVLIANYVLLRTVWAVVQFVMGRWVERDPKAMYCEGCYKPTQEATMWSLPYKDISSPGAAKSISRSGFSSTRGLLQDDDHE
ncbi:hypothetical protein LTR41_007668 [Exophiala xenobiotica]|nr:hypothetical protein LTR41_007668 [Exophiala xenobiotica]KAK5415453.1 hypothetical protein LTR06_003503 [Exophiala xenobiotica]